MSRQGIRCRVARRAVLLQADDRLSLEREFDLEAHLEQCAACSSLKRNTDQVGDLLASLPSPALQGLNVEASVVAIRSALTPKTSGVDSPRPSKLKPTFALVAAAAAGIIAVFMSQSVPSQNEQTPAIASRSVGHSAPLEAIAPKTEPAQEAETIDADRMQATRLSLRNLLIESYGSPAGEIDRAAAIAFADRFEAASLDLRLSDWPVRRIVEGLLESDELETSRAAARYLGVRGDRNSHNRLLRALDKEPLARTVTLAFRDAEERGAQGLGQALALPAQRELALHSLLQLEPSLAATTIGAAIRDERSNTDTTHSSSDDLLNSLADLGVPGFETLFDLCTAELLTAQQVIELAQETPAAADWSLGALSHTPRRNFLDLRLQLAASLAREDALEPIATMLGQREQQSVAMRWLPLVPGSETVSILIEVGSHPHVSGEELLAMYRAALEADSLRFSIVAEDLLESGETASVVAFAELLVSTESPLALDAIIAMCRSQEISSDLRQELVLTIGALGDISHASALDHILTTLGPDDSHLAACCMVSLHQLKAKDELQFALADLDLRASQNIQHHLLRHDGGTRTRPAIYKIARELKPYLSERENPNWRSNL
ncbi:MAG: hypothetical protein ACI8X5_001667 [Planctomycetota bacterium]|jgi:hypothetical protein